MFATVKLIRAVRAVCPCSAALSGVGCMRRPRSRDPGGDSRGAELIGDATCAAIALLAEIYPKCFAQYERRRRPLQSGIHKALQGTLPDDLLKKATQKRKLPARPAQRDGLTAPREAAKRRRVAA